MSDLTLQYDPRRYVRLPKPGAKCSISGFGKSYFYKLEKAGQMPLVHVCLPGKRRGLTLISVEAIHDYLSKRGQRKGDA